MRTLALPRVHPEEFGRARLEALGFRPVGGHRRYAARPRAEQARAV
jgi:hypothetical protein